MARQQAAPWRASTMEVLLSSWLEGRPRSEDWWKKVSTWPLVEAGMGQLDLQYQTSLG